MSRPGIARISLLTVFLVCCCPLGAEDITNAVRAYLQQRLDAERLNAGIVVGLVDKSGRRIISYGKLDNGTEQQVDGDTVFELGSVTKTFTVLLLQEMVQRGKMKLDSPVAKYLPGSVTMPTRNGKKITLRQLATHSSGLPRIPDNLNPKRADNPYAGYSVEELYYFLSGYKLTRDPGAQFDYSNLGMGLLGHVIELKAGQSFESLVVDRICRPLRMDSTRITLTPELKARFAVGHGVFGEPVPAWDLPVLAGAGALRSTANDLLKYVAANLGLQPGALPSLMKKTYENGLAWAVSSPGPASKVVSHSGGTGGCRAYVAFDVVAGRGVVALFNGSRGFDLQELGKFLLASDWQSDHPPLEIHQSRGSKLLKRPVAVQLDPPLLDALAGRYEFAPASEIPGGATIVIWREGDRLGGQAWGKGVVRGAFDLYPESETNLFLRIDGSRLAFLKNEKGRVTGVIHHSAQSGAPDAEGKKVSDHPVGGGLGRQQ